MMNEENQSGPKIMHLNECFGLIFPSPSNEADEANSGTASTIIDNQLVNDSFEQNQQQQQPQFQQGSVISMIQCVGSDWALKSQTNFYIPPEYYPGYTYLYSSEDHHFQPQHLHHQSHHHHHYAFVQADTPSNLHVHHHQPHPLVSYTMTSSSVTSNSAKKHSDIVEPINATIEGATRNITTTDTMIAGYLINQISDQTHQILHPPPMTMPYHHPHLELPVPPLHLPWYFAALCWSFTLGGIVMLILTPAWVKYGGGYQQETKQYKRHWFPYRIFAWTLILLQGPSSFLADYVHMTDVSIWHILDRFLASACMSLELIKVITMFPYTRPITYVLYVVSVVGAVYCFMRSQESQGTLDAEGFVFWHSGWHCQPLCLIGVYFFDYWMVRRWGEYHDFSVGVTNGKEKSEPGPGDTLKKVGDNCGSPGLLKRGEHGGVLLSSIVMQHVENTPERKGTKGVDGGCSKLINSKHYSPSKRSRISNVDAIETPLRRSRRIVGKASETY